MSSERKPGRPAPWPAGALPVGRRVRVVRDPGWDGPWRCEFSGTIDSLAPPEAVRHPGARPGERAYWVVFDEPQYDAEGDGPYRKAQIWDRYLVPEDRCAAGGPPA
ncbi:ferrous iron transport protein A [Actinomadura sp. WMMB 499]|uniref:ferrous iron transport protein A n=1 Tax=Actinomadura sp. WMMB 499 TaxID=1219491 RepID=UPI0012474148|nr:ferrous iron transport protein A [Actinomadura sp. WMMB 499]QFG20397.1 ferrous iron transport protein A [Actinomadura sp. WMMB 499]